MTEEKKANEEAKSDSSCCHTSGSSSGSGCCSAKKFLIGLIAGIILTVVAFSLCSSEKCSMKKICPIGQPQMQK